MSSGEHWGVGFRKTMTFRIDLLCGNALGGGGQVRRLFNTNRYGD